MTVKESYEDGSKRRRLNSSLKHNYLMQNTPHTRMETEPQQQVNPLQEKNQMAQFSEWSKLFEGFSNTTRLLEMHCR